MPNQYSSSLIFSEYTGTSENGTSVNGNTMERVGSLASIGLDLDQPMERPNGQHNASFVCRDLVTPPVMAEVLQPPTLSSRCSSHKGGDVWMNATANDSAAVETEAAASKNCFYYHSTKRTVA
jgi:hypothetical protein